MLNIDTTKQKHIIENNKRTILKNDLSKIFLFTMILIEIKTKLKALAEKYYP